MSNTYSSILEREERVCSSGRQVQRTCSGSEIRLTVSVTPEITSTVVINIQSKETVADEGEGCRLAIGESRPDGSGRKAVRRWGRRSRGSTRRGRRCCRLARTYVNFKIG